MIDPKLGSEAHTQLHYDVTAELPIISTPAAIFRMFELTFPCLLT